MPYCLMYCTSSLKHNDTLLYVDLSLLAFRFTFVVIMGSPCSKYNFIREATVKQKQHLLILELLAKQRKESITHTHNCNKNTHIPLKTE